MESYNAFSRIYDALTYNIDYKTAFNYISGFLFEYGINKDKCKIIDLACGTGNLTDIFSQKGYNVLGIDLSNEMLSVAQQKCKKVQFLCCDMRSVILNEKYDVCVCMLDSINHLNNIDDVSSCFKSVSNNLEENGLFIFDVNSIYKHNSVLSGHTFVFDEEDFFLSWDNEDAGDNRVRILLDIFFFNGKNYDRYSEEFYEKAYSTEEITNKLEQADFEIISINDGWSKEPVNDLSERITFVCRRK